MARRDSDPFKRPVGDTIGDLTAVPATVGEISQPELVRSASEQHFINVVSANMSLLGLAPEVAALYDSAIEADCEPQPKARVTPEFLVATQLWRIKEHLRDATFDDYVELLRLDDVKSATAPIMAGMSQSFFELQRLLGAGTPARYPIPTPQFSGISAEVDVYKTEAGVDLVVSSFGNAGSWYRGDYDETHTPTTEELTDSIIFVAKKSPQPHTNTSQLPPPPPPPPVSAHSGRRSRTHR